MNIHGKILLCVFAAGFSAGLYGQSHTSVPLDDAAYYLLEQAELRGLCGPLPRSRPYSRAVVNARINEILSSDGALSLLPRERAALEALRKETAFPAGFDAKRLAYRAGREIAGGPVSANLGAGLSALGAGAFLNGAFTGATDNHLGIYLNGDMGRHFSYHADAEIVMAYLPRPFLGRYLVNYAADPPEPPRYVDVYGDPKAFLPYSYRRSWEGSAGYFGSMDAAGHRGWFDEAGLSFSSSPEIDGAFFDGLAGLRFGRIRHDWGIARGASLFLNGAAQPFTAVELYARPFDWLGVSTLTGVLEYFNSEGIKTSAWSSQNAFSITMFELNYKNYLSLNAGTSVVWPKRFELGYMFPLINDFFYQNDIGDFDNLAIFVDASFAYPGWGRLWLSVFADEIQIEKGMFERDRTMFAFQAGLVVPVKPVPFAHIKLSYTKIEPYCYTHPKLEVPWINGMIEQAYVNQGSSLGYYLPPNADEILARYEQLVAPASLWHVQYQLIRHGADFGSGAVDGSAYCSELAGDRNVLKKFFLHDGAYRWRHILQTGLTRRFGDLPLELRGTAGCVYSYFTNITEGEPNDNARHPNGIIDTAEYPASVGLFFTLTVRLYPRP